MRIEVLLIMALVILFIANAMGQTPPPTPPPTELALSNRLLREVSAGLQCDAELIAAKKDLDLLKAELAKAKTPEKK